LTLWNEEVVIMTDQQESTPHMPRLSINGDAVIARLETLAGTDLCPRCEPAVAPVAADAVLLLAEVIRLYGALALARRESANRLAAMRAALHAARDGETDPLAYLRDELPSHQAPGAARGRR
jgi:hypothetical protein